MAIAAVPPPTSVLESFDPENVGLYIPKHLSGGNGTTWLFYNIILKPIDTDPIELEWVWSLFSRLPSDFQHFRRPKPIVSINGNWIVEGWCAQHLLPGETSETKHDRWTELLQATHEFHRSLKDVCLEPPSFLTRERHRWAEADHLVWSEGPIEIKPEKEFADLIPPLLKKRSQVSQATLDTSQLIHGDVAGNVLFHQTLPPAIIDFSPYWRPVAYAHAMVIIDGLMWFGARPELIHRASAGVAEDWKQLLLRAFLFRHLCLNFYIKERRESGREADLHEIPGEIENFRRVAEILEREIGSNVPQ